MGSTALIDLPGSDVTLISCDGARFQIHQSTLSLASPFFESMFDLSKGSTPVVEMPIAESASVLETLIRFIYPISQRAELVTIDQLKPVLEGAHKLQLQSVENDVRHHLRGMLASNLNPLRTWALAVSLDEDASRQSAMLRFLCLDDNQLSSVTTQALEELKCVSAKDYALLLQWRADTVKQAREIAMPICATHNHTYPLSNICGDSTNPFILWDQPTALVRAWMECGESKFARAKCSLCKSSSTNPPSVAYLISQLLSMIDSAKS